MHSKNLKPVKVAGLADEFIRGLGYFFALWCTIDLTTDYAIGQFLGVSDEDAHLVTSGMMFGRKARVLADLISKSDHPQKAKMLSAFNKIRGTSKREIFAHSYLWSDDNRVVFHERSIGGDFRVIKHEFTIQQFLHHVAELAVESEKFYSALGATREQVTAFADAALNLDRKASKSGAKPDSKA